MSYSTIIFEKNGKVAKITLNRPDSMNAINSVLNEELGEAFEQAKKDPEVDVIIITGAGRAFCTGVDLKELGTGTSTVLKRTFPSVWDRIRICEKPTIAAVNGFAVTGGFELVLCCDIVIASENAKFADTHARVGILPGGGMSQILPRLVGNKKAKELSFTGNYISAQEALQFGLVNRVVPHDYLQTAVEQLANEIISNDQVTIRKMKKIIDHGAGLPLDDAIQYEQFEHMCHLGDQTASEVEHRRKGIFERGRGQVKK